MTEVKNMSTLTQSLTDTLNCLQKGELETDKAREISRISGKIIGSCKVQLDYNKYMKLKNPISFMNNG